MGPRCDARVRIELTPAAARLALSAMPVVKKPAVAHGKGVANAACKHAKHELCDALDDKYTKYAASFNGGKKKLQHAANVMYTEAVKLKDDGCPAVQYPTIGGYKWSK
eukprot:gene12303-10068_t